MLIAALAVLALLRLLASGAAAGTACNLALMLAAVVAARPLSRPVARRRSSAAPCQPSGAAALRSSGAGAHRPSAAGGQPSGDAAHRSAGAERHALVLPAVFLALTAGSEAVSYLVFNFAPRADMAPLIATSGIPALAWCLAGLLIAASPSWRCSALLPAARPPASAATWP